MTDQDVTLPEVSGEYLLNIDRQLDGPPEFPAGGQTFNFTEPTHDEMITPQRAAQRDYLTNYLNEFTVALNSLNWTNPITGYAPYIDIRSWIAFSSHQCHFYKWKRLGS